MVPGWHERGDFAFLEQSQLSPRHLASNRNASRKRALNCVLGSPGLSYAYGASHEKHHLRVDGARRNWRDGVIERRRNGVIAWRRISSCRQRRRRRHVVKRLRRNGALADHGLPGGGDDPLTHVALPAAGAAIPVYRYVYEPDRILVVDPATNIAIQAIPR